MMLMLNRVEYPKFGHPALNSEFLRIMHREFIPTLGRLLKKINPYSKDETISKLTDHSQFFKKLFR